MANEKGGGTGFNLDVTGKGTDTSSNPFSMPVMGGGAAFNPSYSVTVEGGLTPTAIGVIVAGVLIVGIGIWAFTRKGA